MKKVMLGLGVLLSMAATAAERSVTFQGTHDFGAGDGTYSLQATLTYPDRMESKDVTVSERELFDPDISIAEPFECYSQLRFSGANLKIEIKRNGRVVLPLTEKIALYAVSYRYSDKAGQCATPESFDGFRGDLSFSSGLARMQTVGKFQGRRLYAVLSTVMHWKALGEISALRGGGYAIQRVGLEEVDEPRYGSFYAQHPKGWNTEERVAEFWFRRP